MKTYTPQRNGVAERVVAFFRDNPDEELTRADIVAKFDCKAASVDVMLRPAVDAGLLAKHRERGRHMVWRSSTPPEPIPQLRPEPPFTAHLNGAAANGNGSIPIIAFAHERQSVLRGPFPVPSPTKLRIALWSDGALVIERGDTLVASLTADETRHLIKYLDKVLLDRVEDAAA
jgi:hypothetical protein